MATAHGMSDPWQAFRIRESLVLEAVDTIIKSYCMNRARKTRSNLLNTLQYSTLDVLRPGTGADGVL